MNIAPVYIMDLLNTCTDTPLEVDYFENIVELLSRTNVPDRIWEQSDEAATCKHGYDEYSCTDGIQVVLGRLYQTKEYIACPEFLVLNISDWSIDKNDLFIEGISRPYQFMSDKPLCKRFPIRLYHADYPEHQLEMDDHKRPRTSIVPGSVTTREICLLNAKGYVLYQPVNKPYYLLSKNRNIKLPGLTIVK